MKIGITLDSDKGLEANVSMHFGQCEYFLIVEVENNKIKNNEVVKNFLQHGGGGCPAVSEMLKYKIDYIISGGMGPGAQEKFAQNNVKVFGYIGKAKDAVEKLIKDELSGLKPCEDHEH